MISRMPIFGLALKILGERAHGQVLLHPLGKPHLELEWTIPQQASFLRSYCSQLMNQFHLYLITPEGTEDWNLRSLVLYETPVSLSSSLQCLHPGTCALP